MISSVTNYPGRAYSTGSTSIPNNGLNKVKHVTSRALNNFENITWKYIDGCNNLTRKIMKLTTVTREALKQKIGPIITKLGVLAFISFVYAIKAIPSAIKSFYDHVKLGDKEGAVFSFINMITNPLEALDALITGMEGLAAFGLIPTIAFFSLIAMPLGIALVGYSAIKGVYDMFRSIAFRRALGKCGETINEKTLEQFKELLNAKLGITQSEIQNLSEKEIKVLKDRKINILKRHTDLKVCKLMESLKARLEEKTPDLNEANKELKDIKKIMARKITSGAIGTGTSIALTAGLAASLLTPISPLVIPIVALTKAALGLGRHFYNRVFLYKGLESRAGLS